MLEVDVFSGGPLSENGYLARCARTGYAVAIDPGAVAPRMVDALRESRSTLKAILLTHAHFDHVEGVPVLRAFTSAPIHLHPSDRDLYESAFVQGQALGLPLAAPLPPPDRDLSPGQTLRVGDSVLEVRMAPGHSPGHVIFHAPDAGVAFVGDVIFQGSIGRTDLPGGDFRQLIDSIRSQVLSLPDETRLLPGHGPETTVANERRGNPFLISQALGGFA